MELIAKELANACHPVTNKMQVTTILNSLLSWKHVVTSLTISGKDVSMVSLPMLLILEEERMKTRRREGTSSNMINAHTISQTVQAFTFKGKPKKFKRKWKSKPKGKNKPKGACFKCGKVRHFKAKCPKLNGNKRQKEIAMTITEVMMAKPTLSSWWIDSVAIRHIARSREFFVDFKEKAIGEHKVYMGNNPYSDVLGEGKCKISIKGSIIVLHDVLYVPSIRMNLISVPILDNKGYKIKFKSKKVYIRKGNISVKGTKIDNMYFIKVDNKNFISHYLCVSESSSYI
jgi:hypothetical protein